MTRLGRGVSVLAAALAVGSFASGCRSRAPRAVAAAPIPAQATGDLGFFVDVRMLRVDGAAVVAALAASGADATATQTTIAGPSANTLFERLRAVPGAEVVAAPKILTREGHSGKVTLGESPAGGELDLSLPGANGFLFSVDARRADAADRATADVSLEWKSATDATGPVTRTSGRTTLAENERAVWNVPVAAAGRSRDRLVVLVSLRRVAL